MKKVWQVMYKRPGFVILCIILAVITIVNIKPGYYLIGWDNYSSYFNLKTNIFRTFFSVWRDYRGFGVPSDSEIVDLFRQLFFYISSLFVQTQLLDQLYFLICLTAGTLMMYFFTRKILTLVRPEIDPLFREIGALCSAVFYLCNLNTLGAFYFPIVTYNTRYVAIPFIFWFLTTYISTKHLSGKMIVIMLIGTILTSGSYITATILITTVLALGLFGIFLPSGKRVILFFLIFLFLNSFWLLPFTNYTAEKSSLLRIAPTFVDANETQLNKPKSFYSFARQSILYPNFFDTRAKKLDTKEDIPFHPLSLTVTQLPDKAGIYLFPILYILGSIEIIFAWKRYRYAVFAPICLFLFLILSMKEYSPVGFLYTLADRYIPYFGVLFRFGDTKFHAYMAFAGSVAAGIAVVWFLRHIRIIGKSTQKILIPLVCVVLIAGSMYPYRSYFTGHLIGPFMYNKIPDAYFRLADDINKDPGYGRVLHLPYDNNVYWRSYSWGALGSAFLQYMLDKPLMEKTFEPGSIENAVFNSTVSSLIQNSQKIPKGEYTLERARKFYTILKTSGVSYIILDESVSAAIPSRGVYYWGNYSYYDAKALLDMLVTNNFASLTKTYPVSYFTKSTGGSSVGEISLSPTSAFNSQKTDYISLYTLARTDAPVSFASTVLYTDPEVTDIQELPDATHTIQSTTEKSIIRPFTRKDGTGIRDGSNVSFRYSAQIFPVPYRIDIPSSANEALIDVTIAKNISAYTISLYQVYTPLINGYQWKKKIKEISIPMGSLSKYTPDSVPISSFASDWNILGNMDVGNMRMVLEDTVLPIPVPESSKESFVGSVLIRTLNPRIRILALSDRRSVDPKNIQLTTEPNCFGDKINGYSYAFTNTNQVELTSQNGSACIAAQLKDILEKETGYLEIGTIIRGTSTDLDARYGNGRGSPIFSALGNNPKPNTVSVCITAPGGDSDCLNRHQILSIGSSQYVRIPSESPLPADRDTALVVALKNISYQKQSMTLESVMVYQFRDILSDELKISDVLPVMNLPSAKNENTLTLSWNVPFSPLAYYHNPAFDSFALSNKPCDIGYRTVRFIQDKLTLGVDDCYNELSQTLPFDSSAFSVWLVGYSLESGKYPLFLLKDKYGTYMQEYLSLYQGYPDIAGFKSLHPVESKTPEAIIQGIASSPVKYTYTSLYPQPELSDRQPKNYIIHQDSENAGLFSIGSFDVMELPASWYDLRLVPDLGTRIYQQPRSFTYKQILPSFWRIEPETNGTSLMKLNVGYDRQWAVYDSIAGVLFGMGKVYPHYKCDGYANCFEIPKSGPAAYYALYTPERLSFLGWGITCITGILFIYRAKRSLRSS